MDVARNANIRIPGIPFADDVQRGSLISAIRRAIVGAFTGK